MELVREIIVPTGNSYLLNLPDEMIGKQVEVIAFEIDSKPVSDAQSKINKLTASLTDLKTDLSDWKFDRDEANNYDE
ncbi:hypothetical protein [Dyadobacter diqingensis]|uniref:hypothetical protein n=1 Tax=Dyadobacter diqingensis TaxID=2938121 RepID=UPI0020C19D6D|nr:hypothetical protein [Dyadobacter diqingensis]